MSSFGQKRTCALQKGHVRFTPNSDRESGHRQTVMSALPPKADMCGATRDVRFGPIADIASLPQAGLGDTLLNPVRVSGTIRQAGEMAGE